MELPLILKLPHEASLSFENRRKQSLGLAPLGTVPAPFRRSALPNRRCQRVGHRVVAGGDREISQRNLIESGWKLRKIHDLGALVAEAVNLDPKFSAFEDFADNLTDQFWAQHYPGGDLDEVGHDYPVLRRSLAEMVTLIEATLTPIRPSS